MDKSNPPSGTPTHPAATALDPREIAREQECPFREGKSCLYLNQVLGWRNLLDIDSCDRCWSQGSASSDEGLKYLQETAVDAIKQLSSPSNIPKLGRAVLVPLTIRHGAISVETFRVEAARAASAHRVGPLWKRAWSFLGSLKSVFTSSLSSEEHALRHISCMGTTPAGDRVADPCPSLSTHKGHFYCGACGCGYRPWAAVDTLKLSFPQLPCPRNRPGFTPP